MDILTIIYLSYSFVALYFLFLFILIYVYHRKDIFYCPKLTKNYSLSIVVPCYNEKENIAGTIQALLDSDYKGLKKIFIVDDRSTDGSYKIIKEFAKKYSKVVALRTPKNTGKASGAKNFGAKFVKTELIGFTDADSYPQKEAIRKSIGFFNNKNLGAVTSLVLVKERKRFIEKLQAIEYKIIAFTRKLLGFVGAIYVAPGPLVIYRKKHFDEIGGFDETNLTEDIEIIWNFVSKGYDIEMSVPAKVYTVAPNNFKDWFNQRIRWNVGGLQTINKYKSSFLKKNILGWFILPFFILSWFLGIFGLFVVGYRVFRRFAVEFLSATYSVSANTALLTLREINLNPSILVFFGIAVFLLSLFFTFVALLHFREKEFKNFGLLSISIYMLVYLLSYPPLLIVSIYKFFRRKIIW